MTSMTARGRVVLTGAVVLVLLIGGAAAAVAVPVGAPQREARAYEAHHVLKSTTLQRCVDVTARGAMRGTRSDRVGAVGWSDVVIEDPTLTAVGSTLVGNRCDRRQRWRMRAELAQSWTSGSTAVGTRRSTEGPSAQLLTQFNSGSPVRVPDVLRIRVPGSTADAQVDGVVTVRVHSPESQDALTFPLRVALP